MVLRRRVLDNRTVSAVAGMKVVLDMNGWGRLFEGQGNQLVAREVLKPPDCECEMVEYL